MGFQALTASFPWTRYSKKLVAKIEKAYNVGFFDREETEKRGMRWVMGEEGAVSEGNCVQLYWMVDKEDGTIVDVRFQVFGHSALIGVAEVASDLLVGKNYEQARRIGPDLIDKQVRDRADESAFPKEAAPYLSLVMEAIKKCVYQCEDLPLPMVYEAPPVLLEQGGGLGEGYPEWENFTQSQKLGVIEEVMEREVRPYIALDGGGVEIVAMQGNEVVIAYQGNCTSCYSSVGATLSYIQQVIRSKVHPGLSVVPQLLDDRPLP